MKMGLGLKGEEGEKSVIEKYPVAVMEIDAWGSVHLVAVCFNNYPHGRFSIGYIIDIIMSPSANDRSNFAQFRTHVTSMFCQRPIHCFEDSKR